MVLDQGFKQTLCDSYFNALISGEFGNVTLNKIIHYVLDFIPGFIYGSLCNEPVNKSRHHVEVYFDR